MNSSISNDQIVKQNSFYAVCRRSAVPLAALAVIGLAGFGLRRAGVLSRVDYLNGGLLMVGSLVVIRNAFVQPSRVDKSRDDEGGGEDRVNQAVEWLGEERVAEAVLTSHDHREDLADAWAADSDYSKEEILRAVDVARAPSEEASLVQICEQYGIELDQEASIEEANYPAFLVARQLLKVFEKSPASLQRCSDHRRIARVAGWDPDRIDLQLIAEAKELIKGSVANFDPDERKQKLLAGIQPQLNQILTSQISVEHLAIGLSNGVEIVEASELEPLIEEKRSELIGTITPIMRYESASGHTSIDALFREWKFANPAYKGISKKAFEWLLKGCRADQKMSSNPAGLYPLQALEHPYWSTLDAHLAQEVPLDVLVAMRDVLRAVHPGMLEAFLKSAEKHERVERLFSELDGLSQKVVGEELRTAVVEAFDKGKPNVPIKDGWGRWRHQRIDVAISNALAEFMKTQDMSLGARLNHESRLRWVGGSVGNMEENVAATYLNLLYKVPGQIVSELKGKLPLVYPQEVQERVRVKRAAVLGRMNRSATPLHR